MTDIDSTSWWERYRTQSSSGDTRRIELYVRSLAPAHGTHETYAAIVDRLEEAAILGAIESYDVSVLGEKICLCGRCQQTAAAREARDTCRQLQWGGARDLDPHGFEERMVSSEITGTEFPVLVPPTVCLGVYEDDDLIGVFPSTVQGRDVGVLEFLDALSEGASGQRPPKIDA